MRLRECSLGDILYTAISLRNDEWDQEEKFGRPRDIDSLIARCYSFPGVKWTFVDEEADDGAALVVGGFIPLRAGVASSWFLATKHAWAAYPREVTEMAAGRISWAYANGIHRVETLCLDSRRHAHHWYEKIGLVKESTMKGYCVDGSDAVMYVGLRRAG